MKTVLVIDDEPSLRKTLRNSLEEAGYRVLEAGDGREGLQKFAAERPDVVLTDVIMPTIEGIETIIEMRKIDANARIIAMSGGGRLDAADVLGVASKFGTNATIRKPFRMAEMLNVVRGDSVQSSV
jgi:DNA-binding response OmpR family regulator